MVVVVEPIIEVILELIHTRVEGLSERYLDKFLLDGPVESFDKSIALRTANPGGSVNQIVQSQEQFVGMRICATELPPVVRQDRL